VCGAASHRARDCPTRLQSRVLAGGKTCKACFAADHTAEHCPTTPEQRKCALCSTSGHSTLQCSKYRPRWVEVATDNSRPPTERSTFAAERIALLQGKTLARPTSAWQSAAQQPPPITAAEYPPLAAGSAHAPSTWRPAQATQQKPAWQRPPAPTALEQLVVQLAAQVAEMREMQRSMQEASARQLEALAQQNAWMQQVMLRLLGADTTLNPLKPTLGSSPSGWDIVMSPSSPPHATAVAAPVQHTTRAETQQQLAAGQRVQQPSHANQAASSATGPAAGAVPSTSAHGAPATPALHIVNSSFAHSPVIQWGSGCAATPHPPEQRSAAAAESGQQQPSNPPAYGAHPAPATSTTNEQ
jgi:hypothetical protein